MLKHNCARRVLQFIRHRMCSTLIHPDKIFSQVVPPPRLWPKATPVWSQTASLLQWKELHDDDKMLTIVLNRLQRNLRFVHKRKIFWPVEELIPSDISPGEYLTTLLRPIVDIFNQLHSQKVLKTPMECVGIAFSDFVFGVTFTAEDFKLQRVNPPIILSLPDSLFDAKGKVTSGVEYALSKALEYKSSTPVIIITNFEDMAVFLPPTRNRPEPGFERISTSHPSLALRVVSTAYLDYALPVGEYINLPNPDIEVDENLILPQGPPQDPSQPLLADEEVFITCHRHSDFDFATLVRDRARALQFFRWRVHVQQHYSKLVAHPNDTLTAVTNEVGMIIPNVHPVYPFDSSEMPIDTANHLKDIQRKSPLVTAGISERFMRSKSFTLQIQDILSEGSERGICTVYRCEITSIDNNPVSSPTLCLKLFDDRFQLLQNPNEDEEMGECVPRWFDCVLLAEIHALNEAFAYDKLRSVQGSIVPWFYGTHQFTLPDGTVLYGLLLEYVEGLDLNSDFAKDLSPERQIAIIQSCRHGTRVLDVADVNQLDWHAGQILLYTNPTTKLDHAVLIDFASTSQTWGPEERNLIDNYFHVLRILRNRFDPELVWKYFGDPDDWDPLAAVISERPGMNLSKRRFVKAKDMFPYILSA